MNTYLLLFSIINVSLLLINTTNCQREEGHQGRSRGHNGRGQSGQSSQRTDWGGLDGVSFQEERPPDHRQPRRRPENYEDDGLLGITLDQPQKAVAVDNGSKPKPKPKPKPNRGNGNGSNNSNNSNNNGNRPNKPTPKPNKNKEEETPTNIGSSEWRLVERLKHHWENTAHQKSELSKKFIFWLDRETDYSRHGACLTPSQELGHCHFVQLCPLPDVIKSFDTFLTYACFIRNRYVGICCPDDYLDPEESQSKPTTRRPQKPPKIPSKQNSNDGSDYTNGICGVSENTRIIGGALADPKEWVWMAALILKSAKKPYCGGTLISSQHVLTAAHCLRELTPDDVTVRLGAYDFGKSADPEAQDFSVDYFKIHSKYNRITNENDLAIIKLMSKTQFTDSIRPICLPQKNRDYAGHLGIVTGWGHTSFGGSASDQLRQVSLPVWNNTSCDAAFSVAITELMLCAGNRKGGKDSCQGDSGGPLMLQGPNNRWMIIGVVSWGIKCGEPGYPGVYTRISEFIDWIKTNSKD